MEIRRNPDGSKTVTVIDEKALALTYSVTIDPSDTSETVRQKLRGALNEAKNPGPKEVNSNGQTS